MTTHHRGTGHTGKDRKLYFFVQDTRGIDVGLDNDNESTKSSDTTIAFGGLEADGHLGNPLHSNQANVTVLTGEINSLQQWVEATEDKPMEGLDHIEWELQNLSLMLMVQMTSTAAPQSPSEKWYANTWTHYAPHRSKQISQIHCYRTLPF